MGPNAELTQNVATNVGQGSLVAQPDAIHAPNVLKQNADIDSGFENVVHEPQKSFDSEESTNNCKLFCCLKIIRTPYNLYESCNEKRVSTPYA